MKSSSHEPTSSGESRSQRSSTTPAPCAHVWRSVNEFRSQIASLPSIAPGVEGKEEDSSHFGSSPKPNHVQRSAVMKLYLVLCHSMMSMNPAFNNQLALSDLGNKRLLT